MMFHEYLAQADWLLRRERDWVLGEFKAGRSPILIATDVASRGLGMFSFSSKRCGRVSLRHDERSQLCECCCGRCRRRRRWSRCSHRSWVRRQSKTGQERRRAHRDTADSLLIIGQLPSDLHLDPAACAANWGASQEQAGDCSMNSSRTFLVWYGLWLWTRRLRITILGLQAFADISPTPALARYKTFCLSSSSDASPRRGPR